MGGNTGNGFRKGSVKDRSQFYNSRTNQYVKVNNESGKIMSCKSTKFKGVKIKKKKK